MNPAFAKLKKPLRRVLRLRWWKGSSTSGEESSRRAAESETGAPSAALSSSRDVAPHLPEPRLPEPHLPEPHLPEPTGSSAPVSRDGDRVLLVAVVLILVLPGLLSWPTAPPEVEEVALEPLRIEVDDAPWYEWALLEDIGEVRARRIVEFVERHGPLESIDELENVPGIPSGWLEKARPHLFLPER